MTPQSEFVPIGEFVTTSHKLELDFHDQQQFIYEMQQTGRELEESPQVIATLKEVKLGRIALLDEEGKANRGDKLWVQFSEAADGRRNATIDLLANSVLTRLQLSKNSSNWDVWPQGAKGPSEQIKNEQVLTTLYPKIRNKEVLGPLLDTVDFDSMAIPHLLAAHLARSAGRREKKLTYRINDPTIQGINIANAQIDTSYLSSTKTEFSIYNNNGRFIHKIGTSALYPFGKGVMEKGYTYVSETSAAGQCTEAGAVTISSSDGFNEEELRAYASTDQLTNEPLFTLHRSLGLLRTSFGLDKETAA